MIAKNEASLIVRLASRARARSTPRKMNRCFRAAFVFLFVIYVHALR